MNVLIACEESQRVCIEFRKRGHNAFSCDIQECSGGHKEWHIKDDISFYLSPHCIDSNTGQSGIEFVTENGIRHYVPEWDLIIAFPPCTYLSNVGMRHYSFKCNDKEKVLKRQHERELALQLVRDIYFSDCKHIAIENPCGYLNTHFLKPNQIIRVYYFADSTEDTANYYCKRTCLWLQGLPPLTQTNLLIAPPHYGQFVTKKGQKKNIDWEMRIIAKNQKERAKIRSKTPPGLAKAMAEQWGRFLECLQ